MPVRYLVSDVTASLAFYVQLLGFEQKENWGGAFAIVERDGLELWLSGPGTSAAKPMTDGRVPGPGGWNRFVLSIPNLDLVVENLRAAGATFFNEPLAGPGGTQVLIGDPDGNPIELFQPH